MIVDFSPANVYEVNNVAQSDSKDLLAFITGLLDMPEQRPNSEEVRAKLKPVIETFEMVAQAYLNKAQALLSKEPAQPRLQKYEQVLSKVQSHALELSELIRPDPYKEFSPSDRRQLFNKLIAFIAKRTNVSGQPFILPVLDESFKYVHFNYVDGFGLLCLPPRMATTHASNRNLSIFWHEAAGFAIATAKNKHPEKLRDAASRLYERLLEYNGYWERYSELYRQSLLSSLRGRDTFDKACILDEIEKLIRDNILSNPNNIDGDGSWQVTWLSEFLEDLYGVMVAKDDNRPGPMADGVVRMLAGALAATYKNLDVGDSGHPSPRLRVLAAISFLCNGNQECIDQRIAAVIGESEDIFGLNEAGLDRGLADIIASVCQEILDQQAAHLWLYQTDVTLLEKQLADDILNARPLLGISLPNSDPESNVAINQNFIDRINAAQDLESLLAMDFTSNDPQYGGGSSWPAGGG
jgi:hypothetical protein